MTRPEQFKHLCRCFEDLQYYKQVAETSVLIKHREITKHLESVCNSLAFQLIDYVVITFDKVHHGIEIVDDAHTRGLFIKFADGREILRTYSDELDTIVFTTMVGADSKPASQAMIEAVTHLLQSPDITL